MLEEVGIFSDHAHKHDYDSQRSYQKENSSEYRIAHQCELRPLLLMCALHIIQIHARMIDHLIDRLPIFRDINVGL